MYLKMLIITKTIKGSYKLSSIKFILPASFEMNCWHFNIMSRINFILAQVEHEKSFVTLGPIIGIQCRRSLCFTEMLLNSWILKMEPCQTEMNIFRLQRILGYQDLEEVHDNS